MQSVPGTPSSLVKRQGLEAVRLFALGAEVKNVEGMPPLPPTSSRHSAQFTKRKKHFDFLFDSCKY
jgi:hypothetical protein